MEDDTTTAPDSSTTGADEALPASEDTSVAADAQAVAEPSESTEEVTTEETQSDSSEPDDKLKKYAASQGLELDSPSAIKAARIAQKAQSEATRNHQKASELEKATQASDDEVVETAKQTGQDPQVIKALQQLLVKDAVRDFWGDDGHDRSFEPAMIETLKARPDLKNDLESLYAVSVLRSGGVAAVKSQGKREALESLAHKQQAAVPSGSATTSGTPKGKAFKDLSIKEMEKQLGFAPR